MPTERNLSRNVAPLRPEVEQEGEGLELVVEARAQKPLSTRRRGHNFVVETARCCEWALRLSPSLARLSLAQLLICKMNERLLSGVGLV